MGLDMRLTAVILCTAGAVACGADSFGPESVREIARRVNEYYKTHPYQKEDRGWIRGTYYTGVMTWSEKAMGRIMAWIAPIR